MSAGIYIHAPFCRSKCVYCDFISYTGREGSVPAYVRAVLAEIRASSRLPVGPAATVYFGGGNPALLGAGAPRQILQELREVRGLDAAVEISAELNPEDASPALLADWRRAGVNRLSLGWQSMQNDRLSWAGRRHNREQAVQALKSARFAGFENIGIDLIFAWPGQSVAEWRQDLAAALAYAPEHFSIYALSAGEGAVLSGMIAADGVRLPDEDRAAEMYESAFELLEAAGYRRYEISNYALSGFECRHNLNYWRTGNYLGFGAGAHSHVNGRRWWNRSGIDDYIIGAANGRAVEGAERLDKTSRLGERLILALRTAEGIGPEDLAAEFGPAALEEHAARLAGWRAAGLLRPGRRLALTDRGMLLANEVMADFV